MSPKLAEPGNLLALRHGADSPRVVDAVATVLAEDVVKEAPWLRAKIYQAAIMRYARAEARAKLLSDYIMSVAEDRPERIGARLFEAANGADNTASKMATELGLTPADRVRIASIVASTEATQGLADLAQRGSEIRRRRQAEIEQDNDAEN